VNYNQNAVLFTLAAVAASHGKGYCYPSQKTILALCSQYQDSSFSIRTLNRYLLELEECAYIVRVRRHLRSKTGELIFKSTLYKFTKKFYNYIGSLGKQIKSFLGSIRLPFMANNPFKEKKIISVCDSLPVDKAVHNEREVALRASSCNSSPPAHISFVKTFLSTLL